MNLRRITKAGLVALLALPFASPAQGSSLVAADSEIVVALAGLTSQHFCFSYTYDRNGNATARTNTTYQSQPVWGSSTYGCFSWTLSQNDFQRGFAMKKLKEGNPPYRHV